jgi:hypothetical protein
MELAPSSFRRFGQLTEVISGRIESTSGDATGSIWLKVILAPDGSDHRALASHPKSARRCSQLQFVAAVLVFIDHAKRRRFLSVARPKQKDNS